MMKRVGVLICLSLAVIWVLVLGSFAYALDAENYDPYADTIAYDSGDPAYDDSYYDCSYEDCIPGFDTFNTCDDGYTDQYECWADDYGCGYWSPDLCDYSSSSSEYDDSYDYVCTIDADYSEYGVCPEENIIGGTDAYECVDDGFGNGMWSDYLCSDYGECNIGEEWGLCGDFASAAYTCDDTGGYGYWSGYLCEDCSLSDGENEEIVSDGLESNDGCYYCSNGQLDESGLEGCEYTGTSEGNVQTLTEENANSILNDPYDKSFEEIDQEVKLDDSNQNNISNLIPSAFILSMRGVEGLAKETLNKLASAIVTPDVKSVVDMNKIKEYQASVIENARKDARTKKNEPGSLVIDGKQLYEYSYSEITDMFDSLPLSTRESIIHYYDNWLLVLELQNLPKYQTSEYQNYVSVIQDDVEEFNSLSPEEQKQLKSLISSEGNQFLMDLREKLVPYELNDIKRLSDLNGIYIDAEDQDKSDIDYVFEKLVPLMIGKIESASSNGYSPENVNEMNSLLDTILIWSKPYSQAESMGTSFQTELGSMSSYPLSGIVDWAQNNYDQLIKTEDGKLLLGRLYDMGAQLSPPLNDVQQAVKKLTDKGFINGLTDIFGLALPKITTPKYDVKTGGEFIIDQEPLNYGGQIISSTDYMEASNVKDEKGNKVGFVMTIPPSSMAVADLGVSSSKVDFDDLTSRNINKRPVLMVPVLYTGGSSPTFRANEGEFVSKIPKVFGGLVITTKEGKLDIVNSNNIDLSEIDSSSPKTNLDIRKDYKDYSVFMNWVEKNKVSFGSSYLIVDDGVVDSGLGTSLTYQILRALYTTEDGSIGVFTSTNAISLKDLAKIVKGLGAKRAISIDTGSHDILQIEGITSGAGAISDSMLGFFVPSDSAPISNSPVDFPVENALDDVTP